MSSYIDNEERSEQCLERLLAQQPFMTPLEISIGRLALIDRESAAFYAREREYLLPGRPELSDALLKLVKMSIAIFERE